MDADLVPLVDDAPLLIGIERRRDRRHEEGGGDVMAAKQVENAADADAGGKVLKLQEIRLGFRPHGM